MSVRRLLVFAVAGCVAACSLFTDLDGLSNGPDGAPDGGDATADVGGSEATASDGGGDTDARADATVVTYRDAVLADEPIAYLRFGEKSGVVARDETVNANHAAVTGTVTWGVPGALGSDGDTAVRLDGTTSVIDLGGAIDFAGTAPFSLEIWFNLATVDTTYRFLVVKDDQPSSGRAEWGVVVHKVDGLYFERYVAGDGLGAGTSPKAYLGRWVHSVSTYDGARLSMYLDGVLVDQAPDARSQLAKSVPLYAGGGGPGNGVIDGAIDELAIYDVALPADRIKAHFDAAR